MTKEHEKHISKLTLEHSDIQRNIDDKFNAMNTMFASKYDITVLKQLQSLIKDQQMAIQDNKIQYQDQFAILDHQTKTFKCETSFND